MSIKNTKDKDRLLDDSLKSFSQITKSLELISSGVSAFQIVILKSSKGNTPLLRDFIEGQEVRYGK